MKRYRFPAAVACAWLVALVVVTSAEASTSFIARLGTTHGAARLIAGGPNTLYVNASRLTPGTWTETLYAGTCAKLAARIATLPPLVVGRSGAIARTNTVSASQARTARAGVLRLVRGSVVVCGAFAAIPVGPSASGPSPSPLPSGSGPSGPPGTLSPSSSASAGPSGSESPSASTSPTATLGASSSASASASSSASASASASASGSGAGTSLLEASGNRDGSAGPFGAPPNWEIDYIYDCTSAGHAGRFAMTVILNGSPVETPVDVTGTGGGDAILERNRAGTIELQIRSDCDWQVEVVSD